MAEIRHIPGGEGYANDGEERVVDALAAALPEGYVIFPNIQVVTRDRVDDLDAILVTPDLVYAIEIKDLAGSVSVQEQRMVVDGDNRTNPYVLTNYKARRISGKLSSDRQLAQARVWPLVILARKPRMLQIDPLMTHRVVEIARALEILGTRPQGASDPGLLEGKLERVQNALDLKPRELARKLGQYRTDRVLSRTAEEEVYEGHHEITGQAVRLRRLIFDPGTQKADRKAKKKSALRAFEVAGVLDDSSHLIEPGEVFKTDDGSLVITSPINEMVSLEEWAAASEITETQRRSIISDVASGIATLHRADLAHRRISPQSIRITPNGLAKVGQLGSIRLPNSSGKTVIAAELDPFFAAPESLDNASEGIPLDLFALGKLIEWLWPQEANDEGRPTPILPIPEDLAALAASLTASNPQDREPSAADVAMRSHAPTPPPEPGTPEPSRTPGVVVDSFELQNALLGAGDDVWQARDRVTGMDCVLKFFPGEGGVLSASNQHRLLKQINHDNVVKIRHVGLRRDGAFLVTEYLEGTDLASALKSGAEFDTDTAVGLMSGLLQALVVVHEAEGKPAHRDLKPANLVLSEGRLVLVDFDLAVAPGADQVGGSPKYLPPDVDYHLYPHDRDLYAAGLVFHELLTGAPVKGLQKEPLINPDVPESLAEFVAKAVAPQRTQRFTSALEMQAAFDLAVRALGGWRLGDLVIEPTEQFQQENVPPMGKGDPIPLMNVERFRVTLPDAGTLIVDLVREPNGTGWVHTSKTFGAVPVLERLEQGLRMGIISDPSVGLWAELRQARLQPSRSAHWSNLFQASLAELNEGAGVDVTAVIAESCGGAVGERSAILGDSGRRRHYQCATFTDDAAAGPLTAYLVTRVLPLLRAARTIQTMASE
ncbi:nuclease-like protein,protein kinase family protein [Actinobacteria bacterium IMCC26207]|nr:nuclease-like protein,protein kinase family protein [Actinobacteria bacterium IMCC26207]